MSIKTVGQWKNAGWNLASKYGVVEVTGTMTGILLFGAIAASALGVTASIQERDKRRESTACARFAEMQGVSHRWEPSIGGCFLQRSGKMMRVELEHQMDGTIRVQGW